MLEKTLDLIKSGIELKCKEGKLELNYYGKKIFMDNLNGENIEVVYNILNNKVILEFTGLGDIIMEKSE